MQDFGIKYFYPIEDMQLIHLCRSMWEKGEYRMKKVLIWQ